MDVEAEIAREEGADVAGSRSSRDERSRTRGERSGEQGDGVGPEQRSNRSRDERAELVWDALEEELGKRRKRARDDTVSQTLVKRRAPRCGRKCTTPRRCTAVGTDDRVDGRQ